MGRSNPRKIFTFSIHNPTLDYMSVHASWWGFFVIGLNWWRISVLEISRRLCVGSAAHDWTSRRPQFFRNVNIPRIIDSVILKYRTELSISELYLAFAGKGMKYEAKVFFYYKNITHHPAITLLEASRVAQNEEEQRTDAKIDVEKNSDGVTKNIFTRDGWRVILGTLHGKCHREKWFEEANGKKFNIITLRNPNVAVLRIFHKQLALRYITLLQSKEETPREGITGARKLSGNDENFIFNKWSRSNESLCRCEHLIWEMMDEHCAKQRKWKMKETWNGFCHPAETRQMISESNDSKKFCRESKLFHRFETLLDLIFLCAGGCASCVNRRYKRVPMTNFIMIAA